MKIICQIENCTKGATYGLFYGQPLRCITHKENYKNQYTICMCGKVRPSFNFSNEIKAICCSKCKKDGMICFLLL